jgi:rod shape-determining protein MreC
LRARHVSLIYLGTALALLALMGAQVRRPDGTTALQAVGSLLLRPISATLLGSVNAVRSAWTGYVDLVGARQERDALVARVERLERERLRQRELVLENRRLRELLDLREEVFPDGVVARVLAHLGGGPLRHAVLVDAGRRDGVVRGWVALDRGAVAGRVTAVSGSSAEVLLVVDPESAVAVRHQEGRFAGILQGGNRGAARLAPLEYVPRDQAVAVGDAVVTSGLDGLFPPGLLVGHVRELRGGSPLTWEILVEVEVDPSALEHVLLVPPAGDLPAPPAEAVTP